MYFTFNPQSNSEENQSRLNVGLVKERLENDNKNAEMKIIELEKQLYEAQAKCRAAEQNLV